MRAFHESQGRDRLERFGAVEAALATGLQMGMIRSSLPFRRNRSLHVDCGNHPFHFSSVVERPLSVPLHPRHPTHPQLQLGLTAVTDDEYGPQLSTQSPIAAATFARNIPITWGGLSQTRSHTILRDRGRGFPVYVSRFHRLQHAETTLTLASISEELQSSNKINLKSRKGAV